MNILVVSPHGRGTPATGVIATVPSIADAIAKARELGYALDAAVIDTALDGAAFHAACPSVPVVALDAASEPIAVELAVTRARLTDLEHMLAGMLGHDVRTPLHAITLGCDLLDARAPEAAPAIDRVRRAARRTSTIVDDLLDAAQLRLGGELAMTYEHIDLATLVDGIVADQRAAQPKRPIELVRPAALDVRADAIRLERAIDHAVGYVAHHATGARVSVELDRDRAIVTASSDGPLAELRANSSVAIGFAVADAVLRAHDGTLAIERDDAAVRIVLSCS
ncbi:MAG TPA: HAMP domain-containing sensor histidine kinase [Kofleriaceae bacterium]